MEALLAVMLAVLTGVVIHLWLQLRNYQRIDYSQLIQQEEREKQTIARLRTLEELVSSMTQYESLRRAELAEMLSNSQSQLELQAALLGDMLEQKARLGKLDKAPDTASAYRGKQAPPTVEFPSAPRLRAINLLLHTGRTSEQVARDLGISVHEVEMTRKLGDTRKPATAKQASL